MEPPPFLSSTDEEHLRLLAIFHIVVGILLIVGGFFPIIHLVIGYQLVAQSARYGAHGEGPPAMIGYVFIGFALLMIIAAWTMGVLTLFSVECIRQRRNRMFTMVVAGLNCLMFPFGTILGIFTFIILGRPSVRAAYSNEGQALSASHEH